MKSLLSALQFLTIIPVKIKHVQEKQIARALIYFPIFGLFLGLIFLVFERMLYILNFGQFSINTILVVLLIIPPVRIISRTTKIVFWAILHKYYLGCPADYSNRWNTFRRLERYR